MLPTVHETREKEIDAKLHTEDVDREMDRLRKRERAKMEEQKERRQEGNLIKQVDAVKLKFEGDFEKLDDEIKV